MSVLNETVGAEIERTMKQSTGTKCSLKVIAAASVSEEDVFIGFAMGGEDYSWIYVFAYLVLAYSAHHVPR